VTVAHCLEYPGADGIPDWDSLYRARGDEVLSHRPVFTGDVFERIPVQSLGETKTKTVIVLQHPCALRSNGIDLHPRMLVAELRSHKVIPVEDWTGHVGKMPLPELIPTVESGRRRQAAFFDEPYLVSPDDLAVDRRIACLSQTGVNLLLQRWVHHNSRVVVPTVTYQEVSSPAYEEAGMAHQGEWPPPPPEETPGWHAGELETSQCLFHNEKLVRMERAETTRARAPVWLSEAWHKKDGMPDAEYDALFTRDRPVIFAYHGYPWLIHRLTYRRTNHGNIHGRGYKEEGTTTTPFDMLMLNDLDRYHLVIDVIDRVKRLGRHAAGVRQTMVDRRLRARQHTRETGEDIPDVRDWEWPGLPKQP
jgi:hypothetical protein